MPGFVVGELGSPVPGADLKPIYTYTWDIPGLFIDTRYAYTSSGVTVFAKECTLPTFSTGREEVDGASVVYKFASMVNWEDVRISFYDIPYGTDLLADKLKEWRNRIWTKDRGLGFADIYKQDSMIRVFNMDASLAYTWRLFGSWPQTIRDGEMGYTRSEVKVVEVVIVYDWAEIEGVNSDELARLASGDDSDFTPIA